MVDSWNLFCSFDWAIFPCFFMFHITLGLYLHIWKNSHLSQFSMNWLCTGKDLHQLTQLQILEASQTLSVDVPSLDLNV